MLRNVLAYSALVALLTAQEAPRPPAEPSKASTAASKYFTDVELFDQNGKSRRLYSDLLQGHIVVINSFFATCQDSCPVMARNLARIQDVVGDRLGKDVYFLSFTVDPEKDTPEQLKSYADRMKAKPGWFFLTGSKDNVGTALRKLGLYTEEKQNHLSLFILGNVPTGLWKKVLGMAPAEELTPIVQSVLDDREKP
jgi:protein SCO1/2